MLISTISDYLHIKNDYFVDINANKSIINKACYTGCQIESIEKLFDDLRNNDKNKIIYNKIITEILKTHEKINKLIESFNKDTDYKYKKIFENRNNYCDSDCDRCSYLFLSCFNFNTFLNYDTMTKSDIVKYEKVIDDIHLECWELMYLKLT